MNEYEQCLYNYIMENKFRELMSTGEYITLDRVRKDAERALTETLSKEQVKLFDSYMEKETSVETLELRYIFHQAMALGIRLFRI